MTEQLTLNEKAYDRGYDDAYKCNSMISYEEWYQHGCEGSYSAYKAGYEDCEQDNPEWEEGEQQ